MSQHAPDQGTVSGRPGRRPSGRPPGTAAHSARIGRLFGIPLEVHWTFFLLVGLVAFAEWPAGAGAIAGGLLWVAALFACVIAHELAHSLLARRRGGAVLGILLLPIGGMSRMDHLPSDPGDEAAIAAVGPATSLLLGGLFLAVGALLGSGVWPPTLLAGSWWARLGWLNLFLGVFNLLPALPMDGGRVLRAGLSKRLPRLAATRVAATVARLLALALIVVGLFYDFWLILIGMFVLFGAAREVSMARAEEMSKHRFPGSAWVWWNGPNTPPPPPGDSWPPPWGEQPSQRSAIDVAVERRGPDSRGSESLGEGVGEHD